MSIEESWDVLLNIRDRLRDQPGVWEQFADTLMASGDGRLSIPEAIDGLTVILSAHHDLLVRLAQFYPLNLRIAPSDLFLTDDDMEWFNEMLSDL